MDIAQYISDLLKEHNEVGLPGIGTFFKRRANAYYDKQEGIFYPPSDKIAFKAEEADSDLLVKHIIDSKRISETSALYFIERFCENIKNALENDSTANISPLGKLIKSDNDYKFESSAAVEGALYFGLKPIKEQQISAITSELPSPPVDTVEETEDLDIAANETRSGSRKLWITLIVLLLLGTLAGLAYYLYPQYFKNLRLPGSSKPSNKSVKPAAAPDSIEKSVAFADSIVDQLEKQGLHAEVEKAPDSVNISSSATSPDSLKAIPAPTRVYEVIVASFALEREAQTSVRGLRKRGIDAKIVIDTRKPKYKISIGTFTSMATAAKEKNRMQKDLTKDAWILTVNNKENK